MLETHTKHRGRFLFSRHWFRPFTSQTVAANIALSLLILAPGLAHATSISSQALWTSLDHSLHITTGPANYKRVIYVFFDPNCIYCHAFWKVANPVENSIHLDIRWVPVAFLKADSMAKDAAILMSQNSAQAFEYNEEHFNDTAESGGIPGRATAPNALIHAVLANNEMLETVLKNKGTPTIVYKLGGHVEIQRGLPDSQNAIYKILTGR